MTLHRGPHVPRFLATAAMALALLACRETPKKQPPPRAPLPLPYPADPRAATPTLSASTSTTSAATGSGGASASSAPAGARDDLVALGFADLVAALRTRAASGSDRDLADFADLLAAIESHGLDASADAKVRRAKEVEESISARWKGGTSFSSVATYFEPDADADRMRRVYLSYDRYAEWTGKPDVTLVAREGPDAIALANGARTGPFGLKFGAKWRFRAHPIVRGKARINVIRMMPAGDTEHMRETRSLLVAFPESGGCRVVEVTASNVDFDTPPLLGGIALGIATKDVRERAASLRSRWKEIGR